MNYYQHHIGDYITSTSHLTLLEHGAYRRLLDVYYSTEMALPGDRVALYRLIQARGDDEKLAVDAVLSEFFEQGDDGWHQRRCDHEIHLCQKNRENGKKGGRPSKKDNPEETQIKPKENPELTQSEPNPKAPITHYPIPNTQIKPKAPDGAMSGLAPDVPPEASRASRINGKAAAIETVIAYLNHQSRRNYRAKNPDGSYTAHADVIAQRLKEGYTVEQLKDVIVAKSNAWMGDEKMDQYLNPSTLFRKSNFVKYLAEAEAM